MPRFRPCAGSSRKPLTSNSTAYALMLRKKVGSCHPSRIFRDGRLGRSIIDRHLPHLQAQVAARFEDGAVLWWKLQAQGIPGTARLVRRWLVERRRKPARTALHQ